MRKFRGPIIVLAAVLQAAAASAQSTVFLSSSTNREVWRGESTGSQFGVYLDRGELSGDSRKDLIMGAPGWNSSQGRVYVTFSGPVLGGEVPAANAPVILTGGSVGDLFGTATAAGWITSREADLPQASRDLVVGAPNANGGAGAVYMFKRGLFVNGARLTLADAVFTIVGAPGDHLGQTLATGDMDGDGYREIIAGAPGSNRVYIVHGGAAIAGTLNLATQAPEVRIDGQAGAGIGTVLVAGDVTGDNAYDLGIGAPDLAPAGAVYLIAGHFTGGLPAVIDLSAGGADAVFTGIDAGDRAGASLAVGPYDGDGKWDLAIGAPNGDGPGNARPDAGEVYVIWGTGLSLTSRSLSAANLVIYGAFDGWHAGAALYMGDIDRSGNPLDLAILAPGSSGGVGDVLLLFGRARSAFPATWDFAGGWDRRIVGDSVGTIKSLIVYDHTGEGAEDVVVGVPSANQGLVYITFSPLPEAVMSYPADGQAIGGTNLPFQWSPSASSNTFRLTIGTFAGGADVLDTGQITGTSYPMPTTMPVGQTLYAHLGTLISGSFRFRDSTFSILPPPSFLYPTDQLSGVRPGFFSWTPVASDTVYRLTVGTTMGGADIADSGSITATSYRVFSLPAGRTLFAQVTALTGGATSSSTAAFTTAPAQGTTSADAIGHGIGTNFGGAPGGDAFLYKPGTGAWSMQVSNGGSFVGVNAALWAAGWTIQSGDFNGDGLNDLFLYNPSSGQWFRATNLGGGNFGFIGGRWAAGWNVTVLDFDGDGRSDVFLYNPSNGQWFRCMNIGDSDFAYFGGRWAPGWTIYPADFNGDGRADLFLYNQNSSSDANSGLWFRVLSEADGSFSYFAGDVRWSNAWTVTPADFNGDGQTDLFLYNTTSGQYFRVTFVNGVATYEGGRWGAGWSLSRADFNGDGLADLFLYNPTSGAWFVVITEINGSLSYYSGKWAANWNINVTDFDSDGRSDLLLYNSSTGQWFQALTLSPGSFSFTTGNWGTGWTVIAKRTILP